MFMFSIRSLAKARVTDKFKIRFRIIVLRVYMFRARYIYSLSLGKELGLWLLMWSV